MINAVFDANPRVVTMYLDYLTVAILAIGSGNLILGFFDDSSDDTPPDPDIEPEIDPVVDPESDPTDLLFVAGPTTATVDTDGETTTTTFDEAAYDVTPTVTGTDGRDVIDVTDDTGLTIDIIAGAGDDTITFGYGANVNAGTGDDVMILDVALNALASQSAAGTIDLTDSDDSLAVEFDDDTPAFVHAVRGQSIETVDGVTIQTEWVDYYVSDDEALTNTTLDADGLYDPEAATRVFRAVIGQAEDGPDLQTNDTPTIVLNRPVASTINPSDG